MSKIILSVPALYIEDAKGLFNLNSYVLREDIEGAARSRPDCQWEGMERYMKGGAKNEIQGAGCSRGKLCGVVSGFL